MGQFYEVQFAKQLDGVDGYGNVTYSVKFTNESESVLWKVQPKTTVQPGTKVFGRIEDKVSKSGKPYKAFKREQQEQGFPQQATSPQSSTVISGYSKGSNNDGMRQGMCINNATNLVASFIKAGTYTNANPEQVAKDIEAFARELYKIDLAKSPVEQVFDVDVSTDLTIEDLDEATKGFGI